MHSPAGFSSPYMHTHQLPVSRYLGSYNLGASPSRHQSSKELIQSRIVDNGSVFPATHITPQGSIQTVHRASQFGLAQSPVTIQSQPINSPYNSGLFNSGIKYIGPNQQQIGGINTALTPQQQQLQYQTQQQSTLQPQVNQSSVGGGVNSGFVGPIGSSSNINVGGVSSNNQSGDRITATFGNGAVGNTGASNIHNSVGNNTGGNAGGAQQGGNSGSAMKSGRPSVVVKGPGVQGGAQDINNIENIYNPNYGGGYDTYKDGERGRTQGGRSFDRYPNYHADRDYNDLDLVETRKRNPYKTVGPAIYTYDEIESESRVRKPPNAEHESKVLKLKNEKIKRELHVQEQEYKIHILEQENQSLRNQMDQMKNDYKRLNQVYTEKYSHEIDRLHLENQDYENSNKQWAGRFKDLELKCDDLVHDKQDFEEENRKLNDKILKIQVLLHEQPIKNQMKYENANKNY